MKHTITSTIIIILINILITYGCVHYFVLSKTTLIEEGVYTAKTIHQKEGKIIIDTGATLVGDITIEQGEIILKNNSRLQGSIALASGTIRIEKNVHITGNILFDGSIHIGENSTIHGNISTGSTLRKHSTSTIGGHKPHLFETTNYPLFMKYFDSLPKNHKNKFGYIFLTSHNMDIRDANVQPDEYFKKILYYKHNTLHELDIHNPTNQKLLTDLYNNARTFITNLPERKVGRFGVGFVTKSGAFNTQKPDMYISSNTANSALFMHEYGHVMDYVHNFIDYHTPPYPYPNKKDVITGYGSYHPGEDFAEGYRFYVLYRKLFAKKAQENNIIQQKYNFFKNHVFSS